MGINQDRRAVRASSHCTACGFGHMLQPAICCPVVCVSLSTGVVPRFALDLRLWAERVAAAPRKQQ